MDESYQGRAKKFDYEFTFPTRQIFLMVLTVLGTAAICFLLFPSVEPVFLANPFMNGVILSVFGFGVIACFAQIGQLTASIRWIVGFAEARVGQDQLKVPRLLTTLARLLRTPSARHRLTQLSAQSALESVVTRIEETREISRYIINLLIFLGLLGTFFGLATTIPAVVDTIKSLSPKDDETGIAVFGRLISGLETQLGGMGTAFASSLLGLAGSLVVGLMELFARHGQNRFYRELEDWMSLLVRPTSSGEMQQSVTGDGGQQGALSTVGAEMAERLENIGWTLEEFSKTQERTSTLIEQMTQTVSKQVGYHGAIAELAKNQIEVLEGIRETLKLLSAANNDDPMGRVSLQNVEKQTARLIEELHAGFEEMNKTLHSNVSPPSPDFEPRDNARK